MAEMSEERIALSARSERSESAKRLCRDIGESTSGHWPFQKSIVVDADLSHNGDPDGSHQRNSDFFCSFENCGPFMRCGRVLCT
jgi:hypothetical protein